MMAQDRKIVSFIILDKDLPLITGGQIYDNTIYEILNNNENFEAHYHALENPVSKRFPFLAPFVYIIKGFKFRKSDVIVFNSTLYMRFLLLLLILRLWGHKNILTIHHHFLFMQLKGLKAKIYKPLEWLFLRLSNYLVIPSPYITDLLKGKINKNKILYWRIPFNKEINHDCNPQKGNLTFIGTLEERKGLHHLLPALKYLQEKNIDFKMNIVGSPVDEKYYNNLKEYINKYNLNVEFIGFQGEEGKRKIFSETDIFVFPSLLEGYGMVLVEAQTFGLPIVTFNNSAMPYTVKHNENGILVSTGDSLELGKAIFKLINDRDLRERLSSKAYENVKLQNDLPHFQESILKFFNNI